MRMIWGQQRKHLLSSLLRFLGKIVVANMVALGTVGMLSGLVSEENLEKALITRVPKGTEKMNLNALYRGIEEANKVDLNTLPKAVMSNEDEV